MKRLVPLVAVVFACLVLAPAALAQSRCQCDPGGGASTFSASGVVTANSGGALSVTVKQGCPELSGTSICVNVPSTAVLYSIAGHQETATTLADIVAGDQVTIRGTIDGSSGPPCYTATCVRVRVPSFTCMGSVTNIATSDATDGTLSVTVAYGCPDLSGTSISVNITSASALCAVADHQKTAATLADVAVGDKVAICGTIDASSSTPVYAATGVCDFGPAASLPLLSALRRRCGQRQVAPARATR